MASLLEDDGTPWRMFDAKTGQLDFLAMTRKLFRDYYKLADLPLPAYFADGLCDDFGENTRAKWAKLYLAKEEEFRFRAEKNSLIFDITKLNSFNGFSNDAVEEYRNALPVELCVDGINGKTANLLKLRPRRFISGLGLMIHTLSRRQNPPHRHQQPRRQPQRKRKKAFGRAYLVSHPSPLVKEARLCNDNG